MSGGGGGLAAPERVKRGKQSKRKKKKRVGFVLDMTPLVDITFLLLTFFMFTTTMATPQVMEMSIPPEQVQIEVKESELLTLLVRQDGKIFWHMANDDPQAIKLQEVKKMSEIENLRPGIENKLIVVLKPSDDAPYGAVVSVLDQLNLAEMKIVEAMSKLKDEKGEPMKRKRKFTLAPLSDEEKDKIGGL